MSKGFHERPYLTPSNDPRVVAHVEASRTARHWLPDIEACLVEQELSSELAETVAGYMDVTGLSVTRAVLDIKSVLRPPPSSS